MSLRNSYLFTSEAVSEGHPDKVCDQISDAVLDEVLRLDYAARQAGGDSCRDRAPAHVACETLATTDFVALAGEITALGLEGIDYDGIVRRVVRRIGYDREGEGFNAETLKVDVRLHGQSPDIAGGVNRRNPDEQGAGDQGIMFGYACNETEALMPAPLYYSQRILQELAALRRKAGYEFLRPDAKSQLTFEYRDGKPVGIRQIVVSHQHTEGSNDRVHAVVKELLERVLPAKYLDGVVLEEGRNLYINPTGNFVIGGPYGDCGLTGRKIIVDSYGGAGRHGGGAFSGKDPSKVDRSACYMMRYIAKNLVAAGVADRCEIQVAYAIGVAKPLSFNVNLFGTGRVAEEKVEEMLMSNEIFDCRPARIISELGLLHPNGWCYEDTAAYGHFGREIFPWEKTEKVDAIRQCLKM
ncbi:MAG: methionine adenosyltransferase [Lentisphaeria bacterium]|nr:methionine adenosyltransferase [Lentisphaeria bacterium]